MRTNPADIVIDETEVDDTATFTRKSGERIERLAQRCREVLENTETEIRIPICQKEIQAPTNGKPTLFRRVSNALFYRGN